MERGDAVGAEALRAEDIDASAVDEDGCTPLHRAAERGTRAGVEGLLERGTMLEAKTKDGQTALFRAVLNGNRDVIECLLEHGADVSTSDSRGWQPLHAAAQYGDVGIIELLLKRGADIHGLSKEGLNVLQAAALHGSVDAIQFFAREGMDVNAGDKVGRTALYKAAGAGQQAAIKCLLDLGAEITQATDDGYTPLHIAAQFGDVRVIELLLEKGASSHHRANNGYTALHIAADNGSDDAVTYLVARGLDATAVSEDGWSVLHGAALGCGIRTIEMLVQNGANLHAVTRENKSVLYVAVGGGKVDIVEYLIAQGLEVNVADQDGWTPLHFAATTGNLEITRLLVGAGADIHARSRTGISPLYFAASNGHTEIIKLLVAQGVDVDDLDDNGWSSLYVAAKGGHLNAVEFLADAGADIHRMTPHGESALSIAVESNHHDVAQYLLLRGVSIKEDAQAYDLPTIHKAVPNGSAEILRSLVEHGADVHAVSSDGMTALHKAIMYSNRQAAEFLVQKGVDVNAIDERGRTALHYVSHARGKDCVPVLTSSPMMTTIDLPDMGGYTPLHLTAAAHCADATRHLLEAGANVHALTRAGETALELAVFAPMSSFAGGTVHALCNYGARWTDRCERQLEQIMSRLESSVNQHDDQSTRQSLWCTGLRESVRHWTQQIVDGAKELSKIPMEVVQRGEASVRAYLDDLVSSSADELVYRCKVCVVGPSEWGKTSLVHSIETMQPFLAEIQDRTIGIELASSYFTHTNGSDSNLEAVGAELSTESKRHHVTFWDFAGQDVYQVAHSLFFSRRTLYVLVVDLETYTLELAKTESMRPTNAEASMDRFLSRNVFRWVRTIFARQPDAEFLIVGTKLDRLEDEELQANRVWHDLQCRIEQWKTHYMSELEDTYSTATQRSSSTQGSGFHLTLLKEKLTRLAADAWLVVSSTRVDSIESLREALLHKIEVTDRGFPMWNKYSRVASIIAAMRDALNHPPDDQNRLEHGIISVSSLCRQLMKEIETLEYDECLEILRTLHDLGDVIWYEHEGAGVLRDFVVLDPKLVIDIVREVISHEHNAKTSSGASDSVLIDEKHQAHGRVVHEVLMRFPLWREMDIELMHAFKMLFKHFMLAYPADEDVMQPDSDLIVPSYWKVQQSPGKSSRSLALQPSLEFDSSAGFCWEYDVSSELSDGIFEQFAVQSFASFMTRTARANWIASSCPEFQSRITLHTGDSSRDVIRIQVTSDNTDVAWVNMRFYLMKLEKVLDNYTGLAVSRYIVDDRKRHSLGQAIKAMGDAVHFGRDMASLRASMPWLPPDLDWFVASAWRDASSFQELQMMRLVREKVAILEKLVVQGDTPRRYPALWSLEYKADNRIVVLRMLSDLSGKCFHVPIEIEVPHAFLTRHRAILTDGVSLLSNVISSVLSVPIVDMAIEGAASVLQAKSHSAAKVYSLIEQLDLTTSSDSAVISTSTALSPNGAMAVLRDLLKLYNDSLNELSITEISNLECAVTTKGEYVWAHAHEIAVLKDRLTRCDPPSRSEVFSPPASPTNGTVVATNATLGTSTSLYFSLCIETVTGLPEWDWFKAYCTWQLFHRDDKTPIAKGATSHNEDSSAQPSWRSLRVSLDGIETVEVLQQCRLVIHVKRHSRVAWTKFIGSGEVHLGSLITLYQSPRFHCEPFDVALQTRGKQCIVRCIITATA